MAEHPGATGTHGGAPSVFAAQADPGGRAWLAALPDLVRDLCRRWDLRLEQANPRQGHHALVFAVRRAEERCVLKVAWPAQVVDAEARALRCWAGQGAVRLLTSSPEQGALLLERLDADHTLRSIPLPAAAEIAGGLLRRLAIPAPPGLRPQGELAAEWERSFRVRQHALGHPVPRGWIDAACALCRELGTRSAPLLVHTDLHYGNVLAGQREPWLVIDPKPASGEPELAVAELLWTRLDEVAGDSGLRQLLAVLCASGGLEPTVARGWAVVRTVDYWLWGLAHGLTRDPARCRRVLEVLV